MKSRLKRKTQTQKKFSISHQIQIICVLEGKRRTHKKRNVCCAEKFSGDAAKTALLVAKSPLYCILVISKSEESERWGESFRPSKSKPRDEGSRAVGRVSVRTRYVRTSCVTRLYATQKCFVSLFSRLFF